MNKSNQEDCSAAPAFAGRAPSPAGSPYTDNPPRGILIIVLTLLLFSCSDACAKAMTFTLMPTQIMFMRYVTFTVLIVPLGLILKGPGVFRTRNPIWQLARGLGVFGSGLFFSTALKYLTIAESISIYFVAPIFITALAIPLLGETVGLRRWLALVVGMIGLLIIVRPGTDAFQPAAIYPILGAVCWAFAVIGTRKTSVVDDVWTGLACSAIIGLVISACLAPFIWKTPTFDLLVLSAGNGIFSTTAQLLLILAYRYAPASVLAPFSYTQIIWSVSTGYIFFAEVPDHWTVVGAMIVIASGLYCAHRERLAVLETRRRIRGGQ